MKTEIKRVMHFINVFCCLKLKCIELLFDLQTVNIHCKRDSRRGVVNNQILDWSFRMDGILHNASQELVYEACANDIVQQALRGYNGEKRKI